jgi:hypothetical protein
MRKAFLTILGSAFAASLAHVATAAEQKGRKAARAPAPVTEPFRNSNNYWPAHRYSPTTGHTTKTARCRPPPAAKPA